MPCLDSSRPEFRISRASAPNFSRIRRKRRQTRLVPFRSYVLLLLWRFFYLSFYLTWLNYLSGTLHADVEELFEFAKMGSYLEFDLFGIECSHYQLNEKIDMLSDAQRVDIILQLINEGYEDRIIVSHDIHTKHRLVSLIFSHQYWLPQVIVFKNILQTKFGGHGFSHILENIVPKMINRGISSETIHKILVTNPSEWLTFHWAFFFFSKSN